MPPNKTYDATRRRVFYDDCLARVSALPGVRSAAITHSLPIDGSQWDPFILAADKPVPQPGDLPNTEFTPVSANYFEAMGIRLLRGRVVHFHRYSESRHRDRHQRDAGPSHLAGRRPYRQTIEMGQAGRCIRPGAKWSA